MNVSKFKVLFQEPQKSQDVCAYATLAAMQEFQRLMKGTITTMPTKISYPSSQLERIMKEFGADKRQSSSTGEQRFNTMRSSMRSFCNRCSWCEFEVQRSKDSVGKKYRARCTHEYKFHQSRGNTSAYKPNVALEINLRTHGTQGGGKDQGRS